ncbi:MBL fold metallo-hydrolase [Massilia sp. W12]|uniref:MBL fold metallo-hydrolase n=1 Tax=Massilia sp. W12 TaxID=3126507 RepID=UPI0030D21F44
MQASPLKRILAVAAGALIISAAQAGEPIWDANKVEMVSEKMADGVYALYDKKAGEINAKGGAAATSGGIIVGARGALMIDTMINQRLHKQVQQLNKTLAGKPLLYAINTSAHGDHSFGNMYLPAQTLVVQHANTQAYIHQHLEKDKAFMLQYFGKGRGIEQIKARAADILLPAGGKLELDLGDKKVQVIDFGFAQTGGDLWVWEPGSKVMWAGNPVIAGKPALPWLLDGHLLETLETLKKVYAFLPPEARIVPGHGTPIGREDMKWHIDYLQAIRDQVQAAINEGLNLEQTVARVKLPEFGGYALFGWVHPGLNVPAAYKDLQKK